MEPAGDLRVNTHSLKHKVSRLVGKIGARAHSPALCTGVLIDLGPGTKLGEFV